MNQSKFHVQTVIFDIFNQVKHILLKALVAQWVHPLVLALNVSEIAAQQN